MRFAVDDESSQRLEVLIGQGLDDNLRADTGWVAIDMPMTGLLSSFPRHPCIVV